MVKRWRGAVVIASLFRHYFKPKDGIFLTVARRLSIS
jgi:hypothetical protein